MSSSDRRDDVHLPKPSSTNARSSSDLLELLSLAEVLTKESLRAEIDDRFIAPKKILKDEWLGGFAVHWSTPDPIPPLPLAPTPETHTLDFNRKGLSGTVTGWKEVKSTPPPPTSLQSLLTTRAPAPQVSFVRGKSANLPFLPGGLEPSSLLPSSSARITTLDQDGRPHDGQDEDEEEDEDDSRGGWRGRASGLKRGLRFETGTEKGDDRPEGTGDVKMREEANGEAGSWLIEAFLGRAKGDQVRKKQVDSANGIKTSRSDMETPSRLPKLSEDISGIDDLLPPSSFSNPSASIPAIRPKRSKKAEKKEWAHVVDVNQELVNFDELVPDMAFKYPFTLDNFQKEAIYHLEMGDSVFVAAHTSAGKTVVAEYAIALAAKHMTRAIYTSPIKALSNQKFRDFKQTFDPSSIGILTGDVQINPEGSCLIMTTEILRSMLYKGADLIRDVEFVIFDEVHYVNDAERGVVWEEVIILLPEHVNIILLSATVPNTKEFAGWVGRTKKKDIYVISTPKRPVPLEHFLWAGKDLHKILNKSGEFLGEGLRSASDSLKRKQEKEREAAGLPPLQRTGGRGLPPARGGRGAPPSRGGPPGRGGGSGRGGAMVPRGRGGQATGNGFGRAAPSHAPDKNLWTHLINHLKKKDLLPVVCFVFSKKRCEENAASLGGTDLCDAREKSMVHVTMERALKRLKGSDRDLPQIKRMRELLSRGIGIHHGGLLPLVKEVVEILFAQGFVKVLFATETFAMGVNMPARSVVFSGTRKHDGKGFRDLLPGEYTQMSGRAGRRGLDATGVVIIISGDEVPETSTLHTMMLGQPSKLSSQFRLTYNMILNLLRVEALRVEEMIKRSFSENASQTLLPDQQQRILAVEKSLAKLEKLDWPTTLPDIGTFYDISSELVYLNQWLLEQACSSPIGLKCFAIGRVVVVRDGHYPMNLAIILRPANSISSKSGVTGRSFLVLTLVDDDTKSGEHDLPADQVPAPRWPPTIGSLRHPDDATYELKIVPVSSILLVTSRTVKLELDTFRAIADQHRMSAMNSTIEQLSSIADDFVEENVIPEVDWTKMRSIEFQDALKSRRNLVKQQKRIDCTPYEHFDAQYDVLHAEKVVKAKLTELKLAMSDQNLELLPDYEQRIEVLKQLKFITDDSTVLLKGRVACEINSANELILTELILENALAAYSAEEVVALLSCFVFQEKSEYEPVIPERLAEGKKVILDIAENIGRVQDYHKVPHDDFATTLKFGLVEAVYEWARGMPFGQITNLTDVAEGTIVRVITRLDQTCMEVRDAARVIGDADLFQKMEEAQVAIRRDVIFAASLYF